MKTYNVHGVELTSIQEVVFGKWKDNKGIAMNTLTAAQRKEVVEDFLSESKKLASEVIAFMKSKDPIS